MNRLFKITQTAYHTTTSSGTGSSTVNLKRLNQESPWIKRVRVGINVTIWGYMGYAVYEYCRLTKERDILIKERAELMEIKNNLLQSK